MATLTLTTKVRRAREASIEAVAPATLTTARIDLNLALADLQNPAVLVEGGIEWWNPDNPNPDKWQTAARIRQQGQVGWTRQPYLELGPDLCIRLRGQRVRGYLSSNRNVTLGATITVT